MLIETTKINENDKLLNFDEVKKKLKEAGLDIEVFYDAVRQGKIMPRVKHPDTGEFVKAHVVEIDHTTDEVIVHLFND